MVELSEEIIDVMKKVKTALKKSSFEINRFEVFGTGAGGEGIGIDIRRHETSPEGSGEISIEDKMKELAEKSDEDDVQEVVNE